MLRSGLLLLALAVWLGGACAADADKFFDPSLGDFPDELKAAQQAGKQGVLLMFEMENCPYCRKMRQQVLSRDDVQAYFHRHFAIFSVDTLGNQPLTDFAGRQTTEKAFARALKIRGTPSFVIVGLDGRELVRLSGATKDAEEFMQLGRYIVDGHYKTQTPEQFYPAAKSWK
ncbi:MAG: thioredoxin family protein [Rhodocyclaceae bacterium]|nr:thioredoxin family protein [Rhodocyclaceae bacterium]